MSERSAAAYDVESAAWVEVNPRVLIALYLVSIVPFYAAPR